MDDIAVFIAGQLQVLPPQLGLLFRGGMLGFRTLVLLATLRPFSALPASRRAAIVEAWAYGPIGLARQLFRAVRSTALLACYEHPSVLAALEPAAKRTAAEGR